MDRRTFLQGVAVTSLVAAGSPLFAKTDSTVRLIAHRGGVVDDDHPENSPSSLEAAIAAGYWMAEVDVRRTRDGYPILQHDRNFQRFFGDPREVMNMDWSEIKQLRATPGGSRPMRFEELAERCKGKIRLMLDVKNAPNSPAYYQIIEKALVQNDLMDSTYILSDVEAEQYFKGRVPGAANSAALQAAISAGTASPKTCYLFEGAGKITEEAIALARKHDIDVIAAANVFEYRNDTTMDGVRSNLKRAYDMGVRAFQIDSVYDKFFQKGPDGIV